jgi:hypothetical protein
MVQPGSDGASPVSNAAQRILRPIADQVNRAERNKPDHGNEVDRHDAIVVSIGRCEEASTSMIFAGAGFLTSIGIAGMLPRICNTRAFNQKKVSARRRAETSFFGWRYHIHVVSRQCCCMTRL